MGFIIVFGVLLTTNNLSVTGNFLNLNFPSGLTSITPIEATNYS